jgi:hypothetical protein
MSDQTTPQDVDPNVELGSDDKLLYDLHPELTRDQLARLVILRPGVELEQGAIYFDLLRPEDGPIKALGGQTVGEEARVIAKRETDFEIWNLLVPQDRLEETHPVIERPEREEHGVINQANLND